MCIIPRTTPDLGASGLTIRAKACLVHQCDPYLVDHDMLVQLAQ